jgi:hypothetical protein
MPLHTVTCIIKSIGSCVQRPTRLEEEPHLKPQVYQLWDKCFNAAIRLTKKETGIKPALSELSQEDVFQTEYSLD